MFALATAVATLITLISACFMSSSQVWEIFKILYWKNGVGWIVILMSMLPMSISGLRAMFSTNYHDMFDDAPTLHMIISAAICCIVITFMSSVVTTSKLTAPVYGDTVVGSDRISSKYLTKSKQVTANHYQQIDGDTFIINGHKYDVTDSHQVKTNVSDNTKTSITVTDYNFKKSTPKWVIEYADHAGSSPSSNQSNYRQVLITGHAIK